MLIDPVAAARSLLEVGYARVRVDSSLMGQVREAFSAGEEFFQLADEVKSAAACPSRLEGYRPFGAEYSETPHRPDLCEFFSVWMANADAPDIRSWASSHRLHAKMLSTLPAYSILGNGVLEALRSRLNPEGQEIDISTTSYVQMNHYRPSASARDLLQDRHEDGHLLTVLKSTAAGLEIEVGGRYEPVSLQDDEFLLLPGSLLTLLTGGLIPPLFHRVRNDGRTTVRQSILHFANPSLTHETKPWIENETNHGLNILAIARSCVGAR